MRLLVVLVVSCAACFPYDESNEYVPVTVRVWNGDGTALETPSAPRAPDPCDTPAPDISTCTPVATVRVRDLDADPRCYYDTKISNGEVGRVMQCPGGQMIVFERARFVGLASGGFVDACAATTYDFPQGDDCTWRTEQRISGPISGPLAFSYSESPVAGRACTLACRQHGSLDVLP